MTTDPYYGQGYDNGMIENAWPANPPEEGVDYIEDDVTQADGTTKRTIIRRPRP